MYKYLVYSADVYGPKAIYDNEADAIRNVISSNGTLSYIRLPANSPIPTYKVLSGIVRVLDENNIAFESYTIHKEYGDIIPPCTIVKSNDTAEEKYYVNIPVSMTVLAKFKNQINYFIDKIIQILSNYKEENSNDNCKKNLNSYTRL